MIPLDEVVEPGDVVLNFWIGWKLSAECFCGTGAFTQRRDNALFQTAAVQPIVDFESINAVLVVSDFEAVDINPVIPEP
jgi:rod shape-determining protein MreC